MAMQNILLAAHAAGLAACVSQLTPYEIDSRSSYKNRYQEVKSYLNIPEHIIPIGFIGLGYADASPCPPPRKSVEEIATFA
jgi:nitroreductase